MLDGHFFSFFGVQLTARPSGVLWWPEERVLCVSDLHLGKSDRLARRSGVLVPPYETIDTLQRLRKEIELLEPDIVICLGDNFDDLEAADSLSLADRLCLSQLQTGRMWIWIQGNHDLGVGKLTGQYLEEYNFEPLVFRHIAKVGAKAEISGHYHPKAAVRLRSRSIVRPCFLYDERRVILPSFGTFTGGLRSEAAEFDALMENEAFAVLTGNKSYVIPMPRK